MHDTDISLPAKPQASESVCILVVLILFIIALCAIAVVNWKVGRGVPIPHRPVAGDIITHELTLPQPLAHWTGRQNCLPVDDHRVLRAIA